MKDAIEALPDQSVEQESFANRKLIRPTLNRVEHNHNGHGHSQNHNHMPLERSHRDNNRDRDRDKDRDSHRDRNERSAAPSNSNSKKTPPAEQTNAENFYYQKQMQTKTPMVVVLRDGEEVHGYIEWYDKNCIKLNRSNGANLMIYKPAIKYMFKEGENGRR